MTSQSCDRMSRDLLVIDKTYLTFVPESNPVELLHIVKKAE